MNADSLLHWLMRTSLEASVLILAILGLRWLLGTRLSPAWRIGLWMLVGAKLMLPAFVPAGFGLGAWMQQEKPAPIVLHETPAAPTQTAIIALRTVDQPDGRTTTTWSFSPKAALVGAWFIGAASILLVAFARQRRFDGMLRSRRPATAPHLITLIARLAQRAHVRKPVQIILMPPGTAPAMVGIRQPKLLLPEDWETRFDDRSLRHVVLHELFHVKRGDLMWNWIALAVQALHWFNPLVWFVVSRFQADRELRCDAGALALLAPEERLDYGHTLLRIQQTFFAPPAIAGLAPCVRNHPTLRHRILMIAQPTARQPWLHGLLVLTLSGLVCYSFTTAHAQEKEVPPKERTRETSRGTPNPGGEKEPDGQKPAARESDGGAKKPGMRDGDGGTKKPGTGDGEGATRSKEHADVSVNFPDANVRKLVSFYSELTGRQVAIEKAIENEPANAVAPEPLSKRQAITFIEASLLLNGYALVADGASYRLIKQDPNAPTPKKVASAEGSERTPGGMRDGEKPRTGERDGAKPREGMRDGEKPRTGERDGVRKAGDRDGAGRAKSAEGTANATSSNETITLRVTKNGDSVMVGEEEVSMNRLRGHLMNFLPAHPGAKIIVTGDADTPYSALTNTVDAVRDNGNKNVGIKSE